jgi:arylsulfatase A-like enzyme
MYRIPTAILLLLSLLPASLVAQSLPTSAPQERPNILFIMSDDHARQALSCYDSTLILTPSIDRIAREGVRFTQAFVTNALCGPSRAVILTGLYSHRNGLRDNRDRFNSDQVTFPRLLQEAGYQTALVGKWHLRSEPRGFDRWTILPGQGEYYNPRFIRMGDTLETTGYVTDLITEFALEELRSMDRDRPFCLLMYHKAPHRNWMPAPRHLALFRERDIPEPPTLRDDYATRSAAAREQEMEIRRHLFLGMDLKLPVEYVAQFSTDNEIVPGFDAIGAWQEMLARMTPEQRAEWEEAYAPENAAFLGAPPEGDGLLRWKYQRYIKDYLRCIAGVDESVGRMLAYLDSTGLAATTLVVYTSDQGFFLGEHGWFDKRFMYEESAGTPLLLRYPKQIPAGTTRDEIVLNLDLTPTLLELAGLAVPDQMQGASLLSLFDEGGRGPWRQAMYYHYYEYPHGWHAVKRHYGVRTRDYKLIHFYNDIDAWELYDLRSDPHELQNLIDSPAHRVVADSLRTVLQNLRRDLGDEF